MGTWLYLLFLGMMDGCLLSCRDKYRGQDLQGLKGGWHGLERFVVVGAERKITFNKNMNLMCVDERSRSVFYCAEFIGRNGINYSIEHERIKSVTCTFNTKTTSALS